MVLFDEKIHLIVLSNYLRCIYKDNLHNLLSFLGTLYLHYSRTYCTKYIYLRRMVFQYRLGESVGIKIGVADWSLVSKVGSCSEARLCAE